MPAQIPRLLFLTGRLAQPALERILTECAPQRFEWQIQVLGLQVAGLMTAEMIARRLPTQTGFQKVIVPGRCRGDLTPLPARIGIPVERGPDELADLPEWFGAKSRTAILDSYKVKIFAEIVDAPMMSVEALIIRAKELQLSGADVIDLGALPEVPFPHLHDAIISLKEHGFRVSVDSLNRTDLETAQRARADYLLSLTEHNLDIAQMGPAIPVLIPAKRGVYSSLARAVRKMMEWNLPFLADPVLEPIHFGFTESIVRYRRLRREFPKAPILMGIGNVTELTDADTSGLTTLLFGVISELDIDAVLTTQVSPHAQGAVREANWARRMMFAAKRDRSLPRGYTDRLMTTHDRRPYPQKLSDVEALAKKVQDPSFRIMVTADGVHLFNRDGLWSNTDPFQLMQHLMSLTDSSHVFYLGVELARAQIAWHLGKRYTQDQPLDFRLADLYPAEDLQQNTSPQATVPTHRLKDTK